MTWLRIDDRFPTNPKIGVLSDRAFRLHVTGLCYCAEHLTDGFVPAFAIQWKPKPMAELIEGGLWLAQSMPDGWWIHDYLEYNPSRAQVEADRRKKQAAGRAGGQASGKARAEAAAEAVAESFAEAPASRLLRDKSNPVPSRPVPDPKDAESKAAAPSNPSQPTDRQMFFGDRLDVGVPAIVQLNKRYGVPAVLSAMEQLHGFPPEGGVENPYGWLDTVASLKAAGRVSA